MNDLTAQPMPRTDAEYQVEIDRLIAQIEAMQREMHASRARMEKTSRETRANFEAIEAGLQRLEAH